MALGGSNKTLTILTRFDADASGYFREVEKVNAKTKEAQTESAKLSKVLGAIKIEQVKQAFSALGSELGGTVQKMAETTAHGIEMGAMFGPWGAAIGGVAGALVGLVTNLDKQSEASLRAAKAAKTHAEALKLIQQGDTSARLAREKARHDLVEANAEVARANEIVAEHMRKAGHATEFAIAVQLRARRAAEDAQDAYSALEKLGGDIWLEERKRTKDRERALEDLELARKNANISTEVYDARLAALNKTEEKATEAVKKQTAAIREQAEARRALFGGNAFLATDEIARNTADRFAGPRSVASQLGAPQMDGLEIPGAAEAARQRFINEQNAMIAQQARVDAIQHEIDLLNEYSDAVGEAYGAVVSGSTSALGAIKGLAKQQLLTLGMREAVEAASQFAYGLGALANPLFAGAAAMHFASAAKHAGAAALAGVGVAAVGAIGGSSSSGSSSGSSAGGMSSGGSSSGASQPAQTIIQYYIVGDSYAEDSPRMRQRNAERVIEIGMQRTSAGRAE